MESLRIRIPERYQSGLAKLISLGDDSLRELLDLLDEKPTTFNVDAIKSQISSRISTLRADDVDEIISTLDSLYFIRNESDTPIEVFSEQVLQAMDETENEELILEPSGREQFKERLIRLLGRKLLGIATKARSILYEHERTLGSARIITDIRLVFGESAEDVPDAAVIVHMLKMHFIQDNQHKDIFVALDAGDIDLLIDVLIHAQEKAETLKSVLAAANIPYIDAE